MNQVRIHTLNLNMHFLNVFEINQEMGDGELAAGGALHLRNQSQSDAGTNAGVPGQDFSAGKGFCEAG